MPYTKNPNEWLSRDWINQYSGETFGITVAGHFGTRTKARVKTYADLLREYEFHPESKCADADGLTCTRQTIGLLQRRHIRISYMVPIGKESNSLEEVESGLLHSEPNVYTVYPDPQRDEWTVKILAALKKVPLETLAKMSGMSRRALIEIRAGRTRPHRKNRETLVSILKNLGLI
jgi:hypothetical protein